MRFSISILTLSFVFVNIATAVNLPPVVKTAHDTTISLGLPFTLKGTVSDDSLPKDSLNIQWQQLTGPIPGAQIYYPGYAISGVKFTVAGNYTFALSATDGKATSKDTIAVTVADSVVFKITSPKAGDTLTIGSTVNLKWQVPQAVAVLLYISTDGGKNYLSIYDGPIASGITSYQWTLADSLKLGTNCSIKVEYYFDRNKLAFLEQLVIKGKVGVRVPIRSSASKAYTKERGCFFVNGRRSVQTNGTKGLRGAKIIASDVYTAGASNLIILQ